MNRAFLSIVLGLCSLTAVVQAQDAHETPSYDVEVVIFAYRSTDAGGEELWPARLVLPQLNGVLELLPPPQRARRAGVDESAARVLVDETVARLTDDTGLATALALPAEPDQAARFELLDPRSHRLQQEAERLDRSGRYRVLWHRAWRQPGLPSEQALAVHVRAGEPTELPLVDLTEALDLGALLRQSGAIELPGLFAEEPWLEQIVGQVLPPRVLLPPDSRKIRIYPLDGSLRLEMGRYLHLYSDLILTEAVGILPSQTRGVAGLRGAAAQALQSFPVRNHRRMRSGELHHLDHPILGLLVLTTRIEATPDARLGGDDTTGVSEHEALPDNGAQ